MTKNDWQGFIYAALGIPEAVTDKETIARELLDRRFAPSTAAAGDPTRQAGRADAHDAILTGLAQCLEDGELDRLLVRLEDIEAAAGRLAGLIGKSIEAEDVRARQTILSYLLPGILAGAGGTTERQPINLPHALRPKVW